MYRLIAYAKNGVQRFPVTRGELLVGSDLGCEIHLPYSDVGERHARITTGPDGLRIEDLGASKGVLVNGERVHEATLEALDEIRLGSVTLLVEEALAGEPLPAEPAAAVASSVSIVTPEAMTRHLAAVSQWVLTDTESRVTLESLVRQILDDFGGGVLLLCHGGSADNPGIKFVVATEANFLTSATELLAQVGSSSSGSDGLPTASWIDDGTLLGETCALFSTTVSAMRRSYQVICALPRFQSSEWSALASFQALSDLLIQGLIHHVGRYEPILPGQGERRDLSLAPGLILGESRAMMSVVEALRSVPDPNVRILFLGEPGSGREALARTVHLSGRRRDQPFVIANCVGSDMREIEADLFGAEVPGGQGLLLREGRISLADGGTLYLEEPEQLSLELQARLVHFLRSGQISEPGSTANTSRAVDVRILAASRQPLQSTAVEDRFRVDLAYRLSEFTIHVPGPTSLARQAHRVRDRCPRS